MTRPTHVWIILDVDGAALSVYASEEDAIDVLSRSGEGEWTIARCVVEPASRPEPAPRPEPVTPPECWAVLDAAGAHIGAYASEAAARASITWVSRKACTVARYALVPEPPPPVFDRAWVVCGCATGEPLGIYNDIESAKEFSENGNKRPDPIVEVVPATRVAELEARLDEAGKALGAVVCAGLMQEGEEMPDLLDHAAVRAIIRVVKERDAARAEVARLREALRHISGGGGGWTSLWKRLAKVNHKRLALLDRVGQVQGQRLATLEMNLANAHARILTLEKDLEEC